MEYFVDWVRKQGGDPGLTSVAASVESHLMAFAAEKSRLEGRTVTMAEYRREIGDVPPLPGPMGKGRHR
jgi:hypothetical protein